MMKKLVISAGAAVLVSLGALALPGTAAAQVAVSVQFGPPAPRHEVVPPPRRGYVWAPGHYEYRHNRYIWESGRWMRSRPGYAYRQPRWNQENGRWVYRQARWDRDRDGVPDRYDRRPDRPHPARYDRDRDGVANQYDRRPNDPSRR